MSEIGLTEADWQALYIRLERPLYNLAYRYMWNRQEAQDIVHDAFLQIWVRRRTIRPESSDRYLWVSVLNLSRRLRIWRRAKQFLYGDEAFLELIASGSPQDQAAAEQEERLLHDAIDHLPERLRSVLMLTEFGEMDYDSVARLLAIPAGTVASRRHLAVQQLRLKLKAGPHEQP